MLKLQGLIKMLIFCPVPDAGALFCKSVVYYWITQKENRKPRKWNGYYCCTDTMYNLSARS